MRTYCNNFFCNIVVAKIITIARLCLFVRCFIQISFIFTLLARLTDLFADNIDQDQTAQNVQSDLDLYCPIMRYIPSQKYFEIATFQLLSRLGIIFEHSYVAEERSKTLLSWDAFTALNETFLPKQWLLSAFTSTKQWFGERERERGEMKIVTIITTHI